MRYWVKCKACGRDIMSIEKKVLSNYDIAEIANSIICDCGKRDLTFSDKTDTKLWSKIVNIFTPTAKEEEEEKPVEVIKK